MLEQSFGFGEMLLHSTSWQTVWPFHITEAIVISGTTARRLPGHCFGCTLTMAHFSCLPSIVKDLCYGLQCCPGTVSGFCCLAVSKCPHRNHDVIIFGSYLPRPPVRTHTFPQRRNDATDSSMTRRGTIVFLLYL